VLKAPKAGVLVIINTKTLFLLALSLLMGCEDEQQKTPIQKPAPIVQKFAPELYALPLAPIVPEVIIKKVEEPVKTPVEFATLDPLMREQQAKHLRGRRLSLKRQKVQDAEESSKTVQCRLQDEDYQQWEKPLPEDKSTFPVDRSRILTADMRIGAILEDNINSQIAGRVIVIVDRDIFSPNGRFILLPAYTRVICGYEGLEQTGDTRLPLVCTRAIRPDGVSLLLTDSIGSDQMGRTGLIGKVDNRTFERYGAAFIISGISALGQNSVQPNQPPWVQNSVNTFSNNLSQVTLEAIKKNVDLRPIISINAGTRIQIIPQTDIVFRKPMAEEPL
jgi:type IV secretion system protein VirB10